MIPAPRTTISSACAFAGLAFSRGLIVTVSRLAASSDITGAMGAMQEAESGITV